MSIFAGIVTRRSGSPVTDAEVEALRGCLVRGAPAPSWVESRTDGAFLVKASFGAFEDAGLVEGDATVSMVAGAPFLGEGRAGRATDLDRLHAAGADATTDLRDARGVFAFCHLDRARGELLLATDRQGVRPVYVWHDAERVVFATALRVLEALPFVPKRLSLRGTSETALFGFPIADRTPYASIRRLQPGTALRVGAAGVEVKRYWDWVEVANSRPAPLPAVTLYRTFRDAMEIRLAGATSARAYLSGGLDSRSIVTLLVDEGCEVATVGFSPPGSKDDQYGEAFARTAGVSHRNLPRHDGAPNWSQLMADALAAVDDPATRVWSGDGGSVILGHVYMTRELVTLLRSGRIDEAIDRYLAAQSVQIPRRLLTETHRDAIDTLPHRSVRDELDRFGACRDPGRAFHLFLLENDQARHLTTHFETIDVHRLEFELPFFDSRFVEAVVAQPVDRFLEHEFYHDWLAEFPPLAMSVPWQTYPGHAPCPVEDDVIQAYDQWGARSKQVMQVDPASLMERVPFPRARSVPGEVISLSGLRFAWLLYRTRIRNYSYVLTAADAYLRHWRRSQGELVADLPPAEA